MAPSCGAKLYYNSWPLEMPQPLANPQCSEGQMKTYALRMKKGYYLFRPAKDTHSLLLYTEFHMSTISLEFHKIISQCQNDDLNLHYSIDKDDVIL